MKKLFIVAFAVAAVLGACGGKKKGDGTMTNTGSGSDMGSAAGSSDMGSGAGSADAPAGGGGAGSGS
jgi:hypothetical protein